MNAETYIVGPNDPPTLHYAKLSPVKEIRRGFEMWGKRKVDGWDLLDCSMRKLNFVPDGTHWVKPVIK